MELVFIRFLGPSLRDFSTLLLMISCMVIVVLGVTDPEAAGDVLELADEVPLDVVDRIDSKNASASFILGSGSSFLR